MRARYVLKNTFLHQDSDSQLDLARAVTCPANIQPPVMECPQLVDIEEEDNMSADNLTIRTRSPDHNYSSVFTTIMNIPNKYSQAVLLNAIDSRGFLGKYDFFYLPVDFKNLANMGYAFLNFTHNEYAVDFMTKFRGLRLPALRSTKVCDVSWARIQSLQDNVEHYRNNPINSLADPRFRPMLFQEGYPVEFPRPDRNLTRQTVRRPTVTDLAFHPPEMRPTCSSIGDKIFIGGISADTEAAHLREYFARFGTVIECAIVKDRKTNNSRGFAFCCFAEADAVNKVLTVRQHLILGQSVGVRRYSIKR